MLSSCSRACLAVSALFLIQQSAVQALPLAAIPLTQAGDSQGTTNATEVDALMVLTNTLFQSQAQQIAYGWLTNIDPCGFATCKPRVQPSCSWTGLSCTNWHVTGILLDPTRVTEPGVPAQLTGTISPDIVYLQALQSLQLGDQGITGTLPRVMGLLSALQTLDLSSNKLTGFLPTTWGLLSNLTTLNLSNNSLQGSVPSSWTGMTALSTLDLAMNPSLCNPVPNITTLSPASSANAALTFPICNATVLAAQAASNASPAPSTSPSASPSSQSSPSPESSSPIGAGTYHTSPGINVSVSILVGLCFLLGIFAGAARIRQQQRRHRQLLVGLNQQRRDIQQLRGTAPMQFFHGAAQLEAYAAATTPFCSTPRLVLGPDGQQLALARKLKQQNLETEPKSAVDSDHAEGTGQGCTSTDGSDAVNLLDLHTAFHTKLYTAHLEVDLQHAENAPLPVDLVTPIDTSRRADEVQNQPAAFHTEARQASTTERGPLGRISHSLSRLSAQNLPPEPNQDPARHSGQASLQLSHPSSGGVLNPPVEDIDGGQGLQQHPSAVQQDPAAAGQQQRSWWPFHWGI